MLRKRADYDEPEFFKGDLDKVRLSAREDLVRMEAEFSSYASEIESFLRPEKSEV